MSVFSLIRDNAFVVFGAIIVSVMFVALTAKHHGRTPSLGNLQCKSGIDFFFTHQNDEKTIYINVNDGQYVEVGEGDACSVQYKRPKNK